MNEKTISAAKKKALEKVYKKEFGETLEKEIKDRARTHAKRAVREMMKDPRTQREIRQLTKKALKTKLPGIVREFVAKVKLYHKDW